MPNKKILPIGTRTYSQWEEQNFLNALIGVSKIIYLHLYVQVAPVASFSQVFYNQLLLCLNPFWHQPLP